ncbi:hypothetical protein MCOR25_008515 [Pyricularia grisea]|uniref:MYND-type domain-containing protein n=1 Tax=Pyricularia grisea TaxID=148305 RepID=A0A6P8BGB8_PYRGI|nr:uncharacterized protein PgNI_01231 [Pyricularia grisea]KAI6354658.1 hypothetical protein MCOR25_008515 [Pyricularia grisea]TLD15911.1 hypothetical protein PgNI_01231 [Pyricularia grisea]
MKFGSKVKPLPRQAFCHFCFEQKPNLPICQRCEMVHYCCREHQIADHPYHKKKCQRIAQCIKDVSKEAERLRNVVWDADPYGKFFIIPKTREYMLAQWRLATAMSYFDTSDAVKANLELLLKMSQLGRADNGLFLRNLIPGLMLRLGKDQECYDFLKWWGTTPTHSPCFDDIYLPYLDLKGSSAYEDYNWIFSSSSLELSMVVALILLKIRIYLDLQLLQRAFPPCADTAGSSKQRKDNQRASDKSIEVTATQDITQDTPAVQKATENESVHTQPSDEPASLQTQSHQTDAQQLGNILSSNDTASMTKDTEKSNPNTSPEANKSAESTENAERDETSKTESQSSKPLPDTARIIPCLRSNIIIDHLDQLKDVDHSCMLADLEMDISGLYKLIDRINSRFWRDLLDPTKALIAAVYIIEPGGMAESFEAVNASHKS